MTRGNAEAVSSETWARRLQNGDPNSVGEVRNRVAKILRFGKLSIPADEREDLEQEIMTEIWQAVRRPHFDHSGGFWGFVELVTSRRCIDWLRARREELALPETVRAPDSGPLCTALARERAERAHEILADLDPACRRLLELRLRDDLSYREIQEVLGKSEGALRVQVHRCIQQARQLWRRKWENRT